MQGMYGSSKSNMIKQLGLVQKIINDISSDIKLPVFSKQRLDDFKNEIVAKINEALNLPEISDETKVKLKEYSEKVEEISSTYYQREKDVSSFVDTFVNEKLPYFVLFSSFDDEFPSSVKVTEIADNEWAKDLEEVSDFKIEDITSSNSQKQINHQEVVNAQFTEKFEKYWSQDKIKLQIKKNGEDVNFWIMENGVHYFPSQRSQGQRWYLSFYVKIVARISEGKPNVILIDEPGLYLHAKAQKDLLKVLSEHSSSFPILFSTHSPYLIEDENLECVRLVEKGEKGSSILGKVHAHVKADKETLTPILTAIGLGINDSILSFDKKENIVVEGPEDVFYLQAYKLLAQDSTQYNFMNGGGAPNMGKIGAILEGWGANVYYLYDNDKGKKDGEKKLKKTWKVMPEVIKAVTSEEGCTVADILSISDFKKFVLDNADSKYTSKNSEYIRKNKKDKVLLARLFLQKVKKETVTVSLDQESLNNIKTLFGELTFEV
jgi:energy-coupling factor transporter ATP-binding protein EcfA2